MMRDAAVLAEVMTELLDARARVARLGGTVRDNRQSVWAEDLGDAFSAGLREVRGLVGQVGE